MAGQLTRRVTRLEQAITPQRDGYLLVSRYPDETEAEALARCGVDLDAWLAVRIRPWIGGRVSTRLATAPEPVWVAMTVRPQDAAYVKQATQQANERIMRMRRETTQGEDGPGGRGKHRLSISAADTR